MGARFNSDQLNTFLGSFLNNSGESKVAAAGSEDILRFWYRLRVRTARREQGLRNLKATYAFFRFFFSFSEVSGLWSPEPFTVRDSLS